jgi:hypothetical protein
MGSSGVIDGSSMYGLLTILGPILLGAVILWAVLANRNRSRSEKQQSENATRDLYKSIDRDDKAAKTTNPERRDV